MIYIVEDDAGIRELIVYTLRNSGFDAEGFEDSIGFNAAIAKALPELVILDIMLPGEDGISILKQLRAKSATAELPIIMLTAKSAEYDKVIALDSGADDYMTKPFGMMELLSRIKALLRRSSRYHGGKKQFVWGDVRIDDARHLVTVKDAPVELTLKEYNLLLLLMQHQPKVLTREQLLEKIWGYDYLGETRTVDVHIRTLRHKLGDELNIIETVRGVGYRINSEFGTNHTE